MNIKSISLLLLANAFVVGCAPMHINNDVFNALENSTSDNTGSDDQSNENTIDGSGLQVHTINLNTTGDCSLIKFGTTEILIDAGGDALSSKAIVDAMNTYVEGPLEYMIFTHADSDHICNFVSGDMAAWFAQIGNYVETLIDFDITEDNTITLKDYPIINNLYNSSAIYKEYKALRTVRINLGQIKNYYTASQCTFAKRGLTENDVKPGATDTFTLDNGNGDTATLKILYNYYFDHCRPDITSAEAVDRNLISVPALITYDNQKFLFTGDLEEYDSARSLRRVFGESYLVKYNYEDLKDGVLYYKAAHHGSKTSNSLNLLDVIRPQYVVISCLLNGAKFNHPSQISITGFQKWTDYIYLTAKQGKNGGEMFHGTIHFKYDNGVSNVEVENPSMADIKSIYDNPSFFLAREIGCNVYNLNFDRDETGKILNPFDKNTYYSNCYIKAGHIDILVGAGVNEYTFNTYFNNKIKNLCNDHVLDFLIIPNFSFDNIGDIVGGEKEENGILFDDYFSKIGTIVYPKFHNYAGNGKLTAFFDKIEALYNEGKVDQIVDSGKVATRLYNYGAWYLNDNFGPNSTDICLHFLETPYNNAYGPYKFSNSLAFTFTFDHFVYLNVGHQYDGSELQTILNLNSAALRGKVQAFQIPFYGHCLPEQSEVDFENFLSQIYNPNLPDEMGLTLLYCGNYLPESMYGSNILPSSFYRTIEERNTTYHPHLYALNIVDYEDEYSLDYLGIQVLRPIKLTEPYTTSHVYDFSNLDSSDYLHSYSVVPTVAQFLNSR